MHDFARISNLPSLFFRQVERYGNAPFLWAKRDGAWTAFSWKNLEHQVVALAGLLLDMGVKPGDRVALVSENRPEWVVADLAIMAVGAITAPAYTTNTVENHVHILSDSGSRVAIVSGDALAERLIPACVKSGVWNVVSMDGLTLKIPQGMTVHPWPTAGGDRSREEDKRRVREIVDGLERSATCCLIYTSGTGGTPTGVMLSHGAIICNVMGAYHVLCKLPGYREGHEVFLSFLPLSHSYEHTCGIFFPLATGAQVFFAESIDRLAQNMTEVRPTIMTAVPRLYETMRGRIIKGLEKQPSNKRALFEKTVELGRKHYETPSALTMKERVVNFLLDMLVRRKVSKRFGGRLKAFVSGGGPLNYDVGIFFIALGVRLLQGYGLTEAAPVISVNTPSMNKLRTVGPPFVGVDVKLAEDGEILVRGELVMNGYWNQPSRTGEVLKDGWLHTGDIGGMDEDGFLFITDRKKDIIVNSGGDNVSPQRIEGMLCLEPEIHQAMVYGDGKSHLVGLIVPDPDFLADWRKETGSTLSPDEDPELRRHLMAAVDRVNSQLSVIEKVRTIAVAPEAFTTENAMMTASLKIRRHVIRQAYGDRLEALYRKT